MIEEHIILFKKLQLVKVIITQLGVFFLFFVLIGIHSMQGLTATTRHGVTRKEAQKILQGTENLFRKNIQLKDVC